MSESTAPAAHDPYAAFRFSNYRFYAFGNFLSVIGRQMVDVSIDWEVYQRTHSPRMLGYVGLTTALPVILFAIPAGQVADRHSRRKILIITQFLTALASGGLAYWSSTGQNLTWMFALLFLAGSARAFGWAARAPFMSNLVPSPVLSNAVTWNSSLFQTGSVIGPAIGGLLLAKLPYASIYMTDAFFALCFLGMIWPITYRENPGGATKRGWSDLFSGIHFVWNTKIILATITLDLFAVLFGGATSLLPIFADQILRCSTIGLGWLRAAPSVGSLSMAALMAYLPPMKRPGRTLLHAVAWFGVATIVFGLSKSFWLSLVALFITGAADSISVIVRHTLVQLLTPDTMRGRVSAVNNVFIGSSNELGAFESGITADRTICRFFGPVFSVVGGGIATLLVVIFTIKKWPEVAKLGSFASLKPMQAPVTVPPVPECDDDLRMTEEKEES